MISPTFPFGLDYKPKLGKKIDYGIAFVGTGGIVQYAHIPAYKKAGFNLVGCYDLNYETAKKVAAEHAIPHLYQTKGVKITPTIDEMWIPDAFVGTIASLLEAIENNHTPIGNSTEDNLNTLRLIFITYISAAENRSVLPSEVN